MLISNKIIKTIIEWLIINLAISLILFTIILPVTESPDLTFFWLVFLKVNVISFSCLLAGMSVGSFIRKKSPMIGIPIILFANFCGGIAANIIFDYLLKYIFEYPFYKSLSDFFIKQIVVIVIIATASILSIIFNILRFRKDELEKNLKDIKDKINRKRAEESISIKTDEGYCLMQFDDLIYLSSHGKKTIFHTIEKDYTASHLIKDIEKKLPGNRFIRIHRQYIINTKYLREMRYYEGGRYTVYLNDEDETMLPVGRNIAPQLKEKFAI